MLGGDFGDNLMGGTAGDLLYGGAGFDALAGMAPAPTPSSAVQVAIISTAAWAMMSMSTPLATAKQLSLHGNALTALPGIHIIDMLACSCLN